MTFPVLTSYLLLLTFFILCLLNNLALPVFEASDEVAHFRFADYLAAEHRLPDLRQDLPSHEVTQPPLYYAVVALAIAPFDRANLDSISQLNTDWFDPTVNGDYKQVKNLHAHTPAENWPWQGAVWAVHTARLVSSLLGVLTLVCVYGIAAAVNRDAPLANVLAIALVAFNPKFIHVSSIVSNDIAVTLAATAACWWMVREIDIKRDRRFSLVLGILCGAAVLCKLSGIGLLAPAAVCLWLRFRGARLIRPALTFVIGYALTAGEWFIYNTIQYGNPLAWVQVQQANAALLRVPPLTLPEILARIPRVFETFWGTVGIELNYPAWVNAIFAALLLAAVIGIIVAIIRASRQPPATNHQRLTTRNPQPAWLILIIWELALLALFAVWLRGYVGTENGRLIFPGIAPIALAVVLGWKSLATLLPAHWYTNLRRPLAWSVIAGLFALSLTTPFWIIRPAFAEPTYLTDEQRGAIASANAPVFAGQIQVLSGEVIDSETRVKPGQSVRVRLVWGALQPIPQSLRVVLDAIDLGGNVISEKRAIPFDGRFSTQRWPASQFFEDVYELPIPADAKRGPATIRVSLFAQYPQPSLLKIDGTDSTVLELGKVKIDAPFALPHANSTPIATFGDVIALDQLNLEAQTWQWRALKQPALNYTVFIHAFDAQGTLIWQSDDQPLGNAYPTRLWDAGDTIEERRSIELARVSRMVVGWYDAATGARLPAYKPDGTRWPDDAALIYQAPS